MEPYFYEGDIIIVSPETRCENNNYCVVKFDANETEDTVLKKIVFEGDQIRLRSLNAKYNDIVLSKKNKFNVIGKVVCTIRRF